MKQMMYHINLLSVLVLLISGNILAKDNSQFHSKPPIQEKNIAYSPLTTFSISGKVTQQIDGKPIANIKVDLYDGNWQWLPQKGCLTDAAGRYTISELGQGSYYLFAPGVSLDEFARWKDMYFPEYYKESKDRAGASLVNLTSDLTDIDFTLEGVIISGTVYNQETGQPIVNMFMSLFDSSWNEITQNYPHYPVTNLNGNYYFGKLMPGFYYVKAEGYTSDYQSFIPEYYKDSRDQAGATLLHLLGGDTTNINFTLEKLRRISGRVTRQDNGAPIDSVHVLLFNSDWNQIEWRETGSDGYYLFAEVYPESYYVGAEGYGIFDGKYQKRYRSEYFQESPMREGATFINVAKDVTNIDFTLEEGCSISGWVTQQDNGESISNTNVIVCDSCWTPLSNGWTDLKGFYFIGGLDFKSYYVWATGECNIEAQPPKSFKEEFYEESPDRAHATLITLLADTNNINFTLEKAISIMGRVIRHDNHEPIPYTQVIAYDSLWNFIKEARTNNEGFYQIDALDSSKYFFEASGKVWWDFGSYGDWNQLYERQFYNKTASRDSATLVDLSGLIQSIDFSLYDFEGYTISGKVSRQDNGNLIGLSEIEIFDSDRNKINFTIASNAALYTTPKLAKGSYYVIATGFCESNGWWKWYQTEYYPESANWDGAAILSLDHDLTNINFTLEEAICIMGRVVRHDNGEPIPYAQVLAYDSLWSFIKETRTNNNGFYQISDLVSGEYYVEASGKIWWNYGAYGDWKQEYVGEYYNRVRQRENATLMNVTATLTDINFYLKHQTGVTWKPRTDVPDKFYLFQNHPNPFNPATTIEFALPKSAFVTLKVFNLRGEAVATLVAEKRTVGIHQVIWDASGLSSGVYLYRLEAGNFMQTKKLILMR